MEVYPVIPVLIDGKWQIITVGKLDGYVSPASPHPHPHAAAAAAPPQANGWAKIKQKSLAELLQAHDLTTRQAMPACGLINNSNLCYLNSVLQALLHCEQFLALLREIRTQTRQKITEGPVLNAFIAFAGQYELQAAQGRLSSAEHFYDVISAHPNFKHLQKGMQEDAQEFMGYLIDTLEQTFDEALKMEPLQSIEEQPKDNDDDWTQVGKHNKHIVERQTGLEATTQNPILRLFGGKTRNILRIKDNNPSITVDPFQQVLLDIDPEEVLSVQDALDYMQKPETLQMEKNGRPLAATKQVEFIQTPPILVMYLKRFTFIRRGQEFDFGKIHKHVDVGSVSIPVGNKQVQYKPFAIIYHHGSSATAGHYTTEIRNPNGWTCIDDEYISSSRSHSPGEAYMAFYEIVA